MLTRRGTTLIELLVALTLAALVLGTATGSMLRQHRTTTGLAHHSAVERQLRAATGLTSGDLGALAAGAGDLAQGEARDSTLQMRVAVATGFACKGSPGRATLVVTTGDDADAGGVVSSPREGDSLWWYQTRGALWSARRITEAQSVVESCPALGGEAGPALRLRFAGTDTLPDGSPLRATRQLRYLLYRASDGGWQLGLREWSEVTRRFAPPQPLAGPFIRRLPSGERTGFRYFDAADRELLPQPTGVDVSRVARIRITALSTDGGAGSTGEGVRRDSVDVALQRRGAR
jgi:hypothetical protein